MGTIYTIIVPLQCRLVHLYVKMKYPYYISAKILNVVISIFISVELKQIEWQSWMAVGCKLSQLAITVKCTILM